MKDIKHVVGWMACCATLVGGFEGLATHAYPDKLAHGLPTVCYGETEGVKLGDQYTPQQCADMLAAKLPRYWSEIARCIHVPISDNEKAAYTSFAYNEGSGRFCGSSMNHLLNAGRHKEACARLEVYDIASGKHYPGLLRRRKAEETLCLKPDDPTDTRVAQVAPVLPEPTMPAADQTPAPKKHWWNRR